MLEFLSQIHFKKIQSWLEERFDFLILHSFMSAFFIFLFSFFSSNVWPSKINPWGLSSHTNKFCQVWSKRCQPLSSHFIGALFVNNFSVLSLGKTSYLFPM